MKKLYVNILFHFSILSRESNELAEKLIQVGGFFVSVFLSLNTKLNCKWRFYFKCFSCILWALSNYVLFQLRVVHNLMYAMGNMDYADSQRQASISLEVLLSFLLSVSC